MRLATTVGLFIGLAAAVPGLNIGRDAPGLLTVDLETFPDSTIKPQCDKCCPTTIRTIISKIYTTIYSEKTIYTTATYHDVSTKVQYTTEYVTTTALSTYTTSYPVTVTKTVDCDPGHTTDAPSTKETDAPRMRKRTNECRTITITSWATTTATKTVTGIESIVSTKTVPQPTTVHDTRTVLGTTTIWVPTTYIETKTVVSERPVTRTVDNTKYTTKSTTIYTTFVSTVTTSYPVVSTITVPQTVTAPGQNVTQTLQGPTVTVPGQPNTITLPGQTRTAPGSTIVTTVTRTLPGSTVYVTEKQGTKTMTMTQPASTIVETRTITLPPTTIEKPPTTVTVDPIFDVTLCPTPTGASAPLDRKSDLTFGCQPGYVCNPPKPNGCNLWPEPPNKKFLCNPSDCIPAPAITNVTWDDCETGYYPPAYGYFNLNPEAFGLSYDIFEYHIIYQTHNGKVVPITTGNWASQSTLTQWPKPKATATTAAPKRFLHDRTPENKAGRKHSLSKRLITPPICYPKCNLAFEIASKIGKTDRLCAEGSDFRNAYDACALCIKSNSRGSETAAMEYINIELEQFLEYCSGKKPEKPSTTSVGPKPTTAEPIVSKQPTVGTTTQIDTSRSEFTVVPSSKTTVTIDTTTTSQPVAPPSTEPSTTTVEVTSLPPSSQPPSSPPPPSSTASSLPPSPPMNSNPSTKIPSTGGLGTNPDGVTVAPSSTSAPPRGTTTGAATTDGNSKGSGNTSLGSNGGNSGVNTANTNGSNGSNPGSDTGTGTQSVPVSGSVTGTPPATATRTLNGPDSGSSTKGDHGTGPEASTGQGGGGGSSGPSGTITGASSGPQTSMPVFVTAGASRTSSVLFAGLAIILSSVIIIMQ